MNKLVIGSLSLFLMSAIGAPLAVAEMKAENSDTVSQVEPAGSNMDADKLETRSKQTLEEYQSTGSGSSESMYDVRKTEAFNLVSSAYRGQFESQGIEGYALLVSNYNSGELTAEDLIRAAIDAGELSPKAMEDEAYVNAVELQLENFKNRG